jgi:transposase InsO family protein/transposase-like protein
MTKRTFLDNQGRLKILPWGFHLIEDLIPLYRIADDLKRTSILSPEARKRLKWMDYYQQSQNVSKTCRHFDISRKTFYYWRKRYDPHNLFTLEDKSKAPKNTRQKEITPQEESQIISLRKQYLTWGKLKLQRLYQNIYQEKISSWKIQYTIKKYKLYPNPVKNEKLQKKRKRNQAKKRITELKKQPFPGFLIALDVITIYWNGLKRYILTAIDTVSKIPFARMYTTKSSRSAADFLQRLFYLLDGSFLNALHDNDSAFHKEFIQACQKLGISQYWSRPHTPTDNPVNENFNGALKREFLRTGNFNPDPVLFNKELTEWLITFIFVRPHQALGYDTPWQFYQKTAKVLPMSSSSAMA